MTVALETTTKSSEPETKFTGGGGWGEQSRASVCITTRGVERYQPSKAEVGEPNEDND